MVNWITVSAAIIPKGCAHTFVFANRKQTKSRINIFLILGGVRFNKEQGKYSIQKSLRLKVICMLHWLLP